MHLLCPTKERQGKYLNWVVDIVRATRAQRLLELRTGSGLAAFATRPNNDYQTKMPSR